MKNNLFIASLVLMTGIFCSCRHSTRIIETRSNNDFIKIEYSGNVYLNNTGTAITNISPGGYVKYQTNDKDLEARKNSSGRIIYTMHIGGRPLTTDDAEGRDFLTSVIKDLAARGHNADER